MGYIRRFLSFHTIPLNVPLPQKCELCFFVGAPGTKCALKGGGGVFCRPIYEQDIKHENVHCNVLFCVCLLFNYN